jgi:hypothetical protein
MTFLNALTTPDCATVAMMSNHRGDSCGDTVVVGPRERAILRYVRRIPGPGRRMWLAGVCAALAGSLATLAIVPAATGRRLARSRPASIQIVNENGVEFALRGGATVELGVEYLRAGDGPVTTWLTFAITGLAEGYLCCQGRGMRGQSRHLIGRGDRRCCDGRARHLGAVGRRPARLSRGPQALGPDSSGFSAHRPRHGRVPGTLLSTWIRASDSAWQADLPTSTVTGMPGMARFGFRPGAAAKAGRGNHST